MYKFCKTSTDYKLYSAGVSYPLPVLFAMKSESMHTQTLNKCVHYQNKHVYPECFFLTQQSGGDTWHSFLHFPSFQVNPQRKISLQKQQPPKITASKNSCLIHENTYDCSPPSTAFRANQHPTKIKFPPTANSLSLPLPLTQNQWWVSHKSINLQRKFSWIPSSLFCSCIFSRPEIST